MSPTSQTEQRLSRNEVARTPSWCKNIKVTFHSSSALLWSTCNLVAQHETLIMWPIATSSRNGKLRKTMDVFFQMYINKSCPISMGMDGKKLNLVIQDLQSRPGACWLGCPLSKSSQVGSWRDSGPHKQVAVPCSPRIFGTATNTGELRGNCISSCRTWGARLVSLHCLRINTEPYVLPHSRKCSKSPNPATGSCDRCA